ncbi:ArsI/CadI family heavy metal resistance metalloenzyme [Catalinimonas niigatensis]|uniref:ArsI/CadI family heavy metal resistance metalloenzyme n=1 Tax=Catalinimonas niigatensis TaxID=1397264 RepID=UPI002665EECF|nr:ArsI/CadI family heavy metal resistance metalloenzyme [Catalinimonas niigatensis]WPP48028.1 ArsI/CadI family heavy metal resistance metalloenzyme [Catalinimonas niigatensis]
MKRLHVNIQVKELAKSIHFYSQLFKAEPSVVKADYAKWMLEDPKVNFALSLSDTKEGIEHLGIQAETEEELGELYSRLDRIEGKIFEEGDTVCCYAKSHKSWIEDPQGVEWEIFHSYGTSETNTSEGSPCCIPLSENK